MDTPHTYAKGDDQFPEQALPFIARGAGCRARGADGNEFIEYGMRLRAVPHGYRFAPLTTRVQFGTWAISAGAAPSLARHSRLTGSISSEIE